MFKTIIVVLIVTMVTLIVMATVDKVTSDITTNNGSTTFVASDQGGVEVTFSGEVELAGTYLIPLSSTLGVALAAAGGTTSNADAKCYDTSFILAEDADFFIAPIYDNGDTCNVSPIDKACINSDSKTTLLEKTSLSESQAQSLVEHRSAHGVFHRLEEIKNVNGIGEATWEKNKKYISLSV